MAESKIANIYNQGKDFITDIVAVFRTALLGNTDIDLRVNSDDGGTFQVSLAQDATSLLHADMAATSALIWTAGTEVYAHIGATAADTNFLMPANTLVPIPWENLNKVNLVNKNAAAAVIHCMYRKR